MKTTKPRYIVIRDVDYEGRPVWSVVYIDAKDWEVRDQQDTREDARIVARRWNADLRRVAA